MTKRPDWSKADWVDSDHPWDNPLPVPDVPERLLLDYATRCNLRCPMCIVWGSEKQRKIEDIQGLMDIDEARRLLDEVMSGQPMVQPNLWGEPLLIPELETVIDDIKSRNLPVVMNTNGLNITPEIARLMVARRVDSVMVSIDAVTPETLQKVRGIRKLEKIEHNIALLLDVRGEAEYPRLGVSFTLQDANRHEYDAFIERWAGRVDVVRMGLLFDDTEGSFPEMAPTMERYPCPALYNTLPVHNDGTARLCCLDGFRVTNMGNAFSDGVAGVWHGEAFAKARYYHETAQWDKIPFCKNCNGWAEYEYQEEVRDGLLIRRSPQFVYYNSLERLKNWKGRMLGGHKPPEISEDAAE